MSSEFRRHRDSGNTNRGGAPEYTFNPVRASLQEAQQTGQQSQPIKVDAAPPVQYSTREEYEAARRRQREVVEEVRQRTRLNPVVIEFARPEPVAPPPTQQRAEIRRRDGGRDRDRDSGRDRDSDSGRDSGRERERGDRYKLMFRLTGRYQNIRRSSVKREEWPRNEEEMAERFITLKQVEAL
jgi:hypothetical protein